jgi:hypothetical protein
MSDISDVPVEVDPFDLIQQISECIDVGEVYHDPYAFIKARKLLNNDLGEAIIAYAVRHGKAVEKNLSWDLLHHSLAE